MVSHCRHVISIWDQKTEPLRQIYTAKFDGFNAISSGLGVEEALKKPDKHLRVLVLTRLIILI